MLVVTKDSIEQSNSNYAQGGIAGVLDPEDRFENHIADTLRAGGELVRSERSSKWWCERRPQRIHELIAWGTNFDENAGSLALGREGRP